MRKLILEEWLSLDGHVADKQESLDFFASRVRDTFRNPQRLNFLKTIDTLLFGRKTYEQFAALWPHRPIENDALAEKINRTPKIVFSTTLADAPWGKWPKAGIESGDVLTVVKQLKSAQGADMVLWGSVSLVQALMKDNLIDEYRLHLCPVLTGGGRKLFPDNFNPLNLNLLEAKPEDAGALFLHYQVIA